MIIGTAGHIDHGKTTLVRALTGADTDRLPEEKRRGISIELGYAFLDTPDGTRLGFIDVPGHERLVHTMIAGASGIDFALLLVAADDGPMPQTLEHLAVLSLLGMRRGAVLITKTDRATPARVAEVARQMQALLHGTPLAGVPVLPVSAATGQGVQALRALLFEASKAEQACHDSLLDSDDEALPWRPRQAFRLAVDRGFTLEGTGTVVTGTAHAGEVAVGDALALQPGPARDAVRVRSLHAQNRPVPSARAGQRCAVALAGVPRDAVARGQWLSAPEAALSTRRIDCQLSLWRGEGLRSGARVHVHLGAASVPASVAVLDVLDAGEAIAPGGSARVQLVLHGDICAWHGERVLLRDASASRVIAGGRVLDPFAPTRYRRTPQRLAELDALAQPTAARRLAALLAVAPHGVDLARFMRAQGLRADMPPLLPDAVLSAADLALGEAQAAAHEAAALAALARFHDSQPDEPGPDAAHLRRLAAPRLPAPLWQALLARLAARGALVRRGAVLHLPGHGAQLSATEARIAQKVAPRLAEAGFEGAWARDLARDAGESEPLVRATLARLARRGELHQAVKDLYYPPATMRRLAAIARTLAAGHGGDVRAAQFRDATGLGRKRAIQLLEYFDRVGLTRRVGEAHRLRSDSALFQDG